MPFTATIPARLHVVLAREASRAVIVRRSPSNWVRLILWHTNTDEFEGGQWLKGRIYGERCGLSPDGSLFVYFASQQHKGQDDHKSTWTAISKPPYLTALALWPKGDTWAGGGWFIDNRTVVVNHGETAKPHPDHLPPANLRVITSSDQLSKKDNAIAKQIEDKGWHLIYKPRERGYFRNHGQRTTDSTIWHRVHPLDDRYYLAQRYYGYISKNYPMPSIIEYAVGDKDNDAEIPIGGANWADWDQQGRLVYARDGQIFAQTLDQIGKFARPLADFNDQKFEAMVAPEWAQRW